jgi:hypothetical protein
MHDGIASAEEFVAGLPDHLHVAVERSGDPVFGIDCDARHSRERQAAAVADTDFQIVSRSAGRMEASQEFMSFHFAEY